MPSAFFSIGAMLREYMRQASGLRELVTDGVSDKRDRGIQPELPHGCRPVCQFQCQVVGFPAEWGINSSGAFVIGSGESRQISIPIGGRIEASNVMQNPAHGRVEQINLANYVYVSEAGFRGRDSFVLEITGAGPSSSGTSRVSLAADVR